MQSRTQNDRQNEREAAKRGLYPVVIRMEGNKRDGLTPVAFFPYAHVNYGTLGCYAHIGQHSEGSLDYYYSTRKPKAADAAAVGALVMELKSIYEQGEDPVMLIFRQRLPVDWRNKAWRSA